MLCNPSQVYVSLWSKIKESKTSSCHREWYCLQPIVCILIVLLRLCVEARIIIWWLDSLPGVFVTGDYEGHVIAWDGSSRKRLLEVTSFALEAFISYHLKLQMCNFPTSEPRVWYCYCILSLLISRMWLFHDGHFIFIAFSVNYFCSFQDIQIASLHYHITIQASFWQLLQAIHTKKLTNCKNSSLSLLSTNLFHCVWCCTCHLFKIPWTNLKLVPVTDIVGCSETVVLIYYNATFSLLWYSKGVIIIQICCRIIDVIRFWPSSRAKRPKTLLLCQYPLIVKQMSLSFVGVILVFPVLELQRPKFTLVFSLNFNFWILEMTGLVIFALRFHHAENCINLNTEVSHSYISFSCLALIFMDAFSSLEDIAHYMMI